MRDRAGRSGTFFDNPAQYPELSVLVWRQGLQHKLRCAFHNNRTAVMLALAVCSIGLSGGVASPCPIINNGGDFSDGGDDWGSRFDAGEWWTFLKNGLALDLLARHFKGIDTAAACMSAMITLAVLVYPLYQLSLAWPIASPTWRTTQHHRARPPTANLSAAVLAVALPCASIWCIAVWGAGHFRWGLASGLSVGLISACLSLKTVSFVQTCHAPRVAAASEQQQDTLTLGEYAFFILAAPSLQCEPRFLKTSARRTCHHPNSFTRAMSEFFNAALVFLALHAACSAMVAPAFRVLATAVATRFPAMAAGGTMDAVIEDGERSLWVDPSGWAALEADGRAGFRFFLSPYCSPEGSDGYEVSRCGSDGGMSGTAWGEVAAAAALVMFVFSPMIHFLTFYGFWHCVCVGCAELWGYPDRHFYGPWWLLTDDPGAMFRLWSTPVHRWLSSCIYRPVLSLGRRRESFTYACSGSRSISETGSTNALHESRSSARRVSTVSGASDVNRSFGSRRTDGMGDDSRGSGCVEGVSIDHGCNGDVDVDDGRCGYSQASQRDKSLRRGSQRMPDGTLLKSDGEPLHHHRGHHDSEQIGGQSSKRENRLRLLALFATFSFSSLVHEAVTFVAMRWTCWPFNSFSLTTATVVIASWDYVYPLLAIIGERGEEDISRGAGRSRRGGSSKIGSEWRGWGAVAFFVGASSSMSLVVDFLAWQWWRQTLLQDD